MCNGGLAIPAEVQERTASDRHRPVSEDIRTIIQIDGDIVVRLGPRLQNLPAEQRRAVLDDHFRAVEQALSPMKELHALITSVTLIFRVLATAWIGSMEVLPLINVLADSDLPVSAFFSQVKIQSHLVSAGVLAAAILVPRLLSALVFRAVQYKLGKIIAGPGFSTGLK
jgi:hypothetical protein